MFAVVFWLPGSFQCAGVLFDVLRLGVGLLAVVILVLLLQLEGCWLCVGFFFQCQCHPGVLARIWLIIFPPEITGDKLFCFCSVRACLA
jgi:hypothetical protein